VGECAWHRVCGMSALIAGLCVSVVKHNGKRESRL
jgi:hypothetical protein